MEIEIVTDLQREEEKLMALLGQAEDFTEEQIAELEEQLPEIEKAVEKLKIAEEKIAILERNKKNLIEFEAILQMKKANERTTESLKEGQSPLKPEEFQRLLKAFPSLLPCPFLGTNPYHYHGYSTEQKYFLRVSGSASGQLLLEIEMEKEFLL